MKSFELTLVFKLPDSHENSEGYLDALYEAGFSDAVIGTGVPGHIAINLERMAESVDAAITEIKDGVACVLPGAALVSIRRKM